MSQIRLINFSNFSLIFAEHNKQVGLGDTFNCFQTSDWSIDTFPSLSLADIDVVITVKTKTDDVNRT